MIFRAESASVNEKFHSSLSKDSNILNKFTIRFDTLSIGDAKYYSRQRKPYSSTFKVYLGLK